MVRPTDLPQPVREHPAHQLPLDGRGLSSPGIAYSGYGVTYFDRDHRLGIFTSSRERTRIPSPRGPMQPNVATTPGPAYDQNYNPNKTKIATSFTRASRFTDDEKERRMASPGPGNYYDEDQNQTIVDKKHVSSTMGTIARSRRKPLNDDNKNPSSADYEPNVAPTRVHHGPISFPHASVKQRNARTVAKCETSDASLAGPEEFQTAERWTRPASSSVSIGRGPRFARTIRTGSADIGPGQYDSIGASSRLARHPPSIGFPTGTRHYKNYLSYQEMDREIASTGGGTGHQVLPSTLSNKGVRLSPQRLQNNSNNNNSRRSFDEYAGASPVTYNPDVTQTRPNRNKGVSMGKAPRFPRESRSANSTNTLDISIPSTLDVQHGAKIGSSKRFHLTAEQKECFTHPSPAEYDPSLPKRPESATRSIFGRHNKEGQLLKESRVTPGPKYETVDMNTLREGLTKQASFPRSKRGLLERKVDSSTPGVGSYDVTHDPMKKGGRSAILYLGA